MNLGRSAWWWLDRIVGALFAALAVGAIANWLTGWHLTTYHTGEHPMGMAERLIIGAAALAGAAFFLSLRRRPVSSWALIPVAITGACTVYVLVDDDMRRYLGLYFLAGGLGLSLSVVLAQTGLSTRMSLVVRRVLGARGRRALWPMGLALLGVLTVLCWGWSLLYFHGLVRDLILTPYDYGNLHQTMWTLVHEGTQRATLLHYSDIYKYEYHAWAEHFNPVCYFVLPFYRVFLWLDFHTIEAIGYIGITFLVFSWIPLVAAVRHHLRSRLLALAFGFVWLLHPSQTQVQSHGFHYESFFPIFFFLAYWCYVRRKAWPFAFFLLVSFTAKESMPVGVICWGLAELLFHRNWRRWGALTVGLGVLYFVAANNIMVHGYREGHASWLLHDRYQWIFAGTSHSVDSLAQLFVGAIKHPMLVIRAAFSDYRWVGWLLLGGPFAFLMLLRPWTVLIVMPPTLMHMLTVFDGQYLFMLYHAIEVLPLYAVAVVTALEEPPSWVCRVGARRRWQVAAAVALVLAVTAAFRCRSFFPGSEPNREIPSVFTPPRSWTGPVMEVLESVPPDRVTASVSFAIVPLSGRPRAYYYLDIFNRDPQGRVPSDVTDIVLVAPRLIHPVAVNELPVKKMKEYVLRDLTSGEWRLHRPYDPMLGVLWLERVPEGEPRQPVPNFVGIVSSFFADAKLGRNPLKRR